jgi:uncharacterized membrane protein
MLGRTRQTRAISCFVFIFALMGTHMAGLNPLEGWLGWEQSGLVAFLLSAVLLVVAAGDLIHLARRRRDKQ